MAFEDIECVNPASAAAAKVPPAGVSVRPRMLGRAPRAGGGHIRYICIRIGAELARGVSLSQPEHRLRLLFGTAEDAGKIRISVDNQGGKFLAKRDKKGNYALTLNAASAEGLFALEFAPFAVERCEPLRPANGQPPHFVFAASKDMLDVDDDTGGEA